MFKTRECNVLNASSSDHNNHVRPLTRVISEQHASIATSPTGQRRNCALNCLFHVDADAYVMAQPICQRRTRLIHLGACIDTSRPLLICHPIVTMIPATPERTHCVPNHSETQSKKRYLDNHAMENDKHEISRQCRDDIVWIIDEAFNHRNLRSG
jgi:hypothetical protein